jgi:hypothetical protein
VLDVAVVSVVASSGDNGDDSDDVPSVSLDVPVLAFGFVVASVPSRTISKGEREGEKERNGEEVYVTVPVTASCSSCTRE